MGEKGQENTSDSETHFKVKRTGLDAGCVTKSKAKVDSNNCGYYREQSTKNVFSPSRINIEAKTVYLKLTQDLLELPSNPLNPEICTDSCPTLSIPLTLLMGPARSISQ